MEVINSNSIRKALYVSAFFPDANAPHAGGQAAYQNRLDLEKSGYMVTTVVCSTEKNLPQNYKEVIVFHQNKTNLFLSYIKNIISLKIKGFFSWPFFDTRSNIEFEYFLGEELKKNSYEIIFVDFTQTIEPVLRAITSTKRTPVTQVCVHDLYIQKFLRSQTIIARFFTGLITRREKELLQSFDTVVTLSEKDSFLAKQLYDLKQVIVRPWTPPQWTLKVQRTENTINKYELLFFANFSRGENSEALSWMLSHAWPTILEEFPTASLVLAGSGSDVVTLPKSCLNIHTVGFVEDPARLFERCHLAIAPLAYGAGVKFKVLEALSCGVPVVGTHVALEGIPPSSQLTMSNRNDFAKKIIELFKR